MTEITNQAGTVEKMLGRQPSTMPQAHKYGTQSPINSSGTCIHCGKHLAGHWIKVYPDGKKEEFPYGYCRDPAGEIGCCMVFRPKTPLSSGACTA